MTDKERIDWLDETRARIETRWEYDRGYIVKIGPVATGVGDTFREAFDSAVRARFS